MSTTETMTGLTVPMLSVLAILIMTAWIALH